MIVPTKLHIPRSRMATVPRPRLVERLNAGLDCELTLITAPAGYGKTTIQSEWAHQVPAAVAWVSLDADDNDHTRFWRHTVAALQAARPACSIACPNMFMSTLRAARCLRCR